MLEKTHKISTYHKVHALEQIENKFVCSSCCNSKNSETQNPFNTSNTSLFLDHQRCYHSSMTEFECIYCCSHVPISLSTQHIQNHFVSLNDEITCSICSNKLKSNILNLMKHVNNCHSNEIKCPICNMTLCSMKDLSIHLLNNVLCLYHCSIDNCLVKTHSKSLMIDHQNRCHNGIHVMNVGQQYLCIEKGVQKSTACSCFMETNQETNKKETTNQMGPIKPLNSSLSPMNNHTNMTTNSNNINNNNGAVINQETQFISLPFSLRVLNKLAYNLDEKTKGDLIGKMNHYSKFQVRLEISDDSSNQKQFVCATCYYRSIHSLADVRKHILGCHCSVSTSYTRLCLRASRLDTNTFQLFSDKKLISFANEKLKRSEQSNGGNTNIEIPTNANLLEDSEPDSDGQTINTTASCTQSGSGKKRAALFDGDINNNTMFKKSKNSMTSNSIPSRRPYRQNNRYNNLYNTSITNGNPNLLLRADSPVPEVGVPLQRAGPIEREITLAYSWPVLELLIKDQCPDDYLPVLHAKMDVYASHKILLARRPSNNPGDKSPGKRYFLCSHCSNSSPHGMNDIRKHILGVHARLPERFKAAAMYCSRMNRENYALLPDEELLKKNQDVARMRAAAIPPGGSVSSSSAGLKKQDVSMIGSNVSNNNPASQMSSLLSDLVPLLLTSSNPSSTNNTSSDNIEDTNYSAFAAMATALSNWSSTNSTTTNSFLQSSTPSPTISNQNIFLQNSTNHIIEQSNITTNQIKEESILTNDIKDEQISPNISEYDDNDANNKQNGEFSKIIINNNKGQSRRSLVLKSKITQNNI